MNMNVQGDFQICISIPLKHVKSHLSKMDSATSISVRF